MAIEESYMIHNILFKLNPALVLAYKNVVETKFPRLVGMLHRRFPKTTLEKVSRAHDFFFIILPTKNKPTHLNCNISLDTSEKGRLIPNRRLSDSRWL